MAAPITPTYEFLSTLSLRRATSRGLNKAEVIKISIHALLAESDIGSAQQALKMTKFLSTLSLRRATFGCWMALSRL